MFQLSIAFGFGFGFEFGFAKTFVKDFDCAIDCKKGKRLEFRFFCFFIFQVFLLVVRPVLELIR